MGGRYRDVPHMPCSHTCRAFPIINIPDQNGSFLFFFTEDEPILTYHNHPNSIIYLKVHSLCCTFYRLEKNVYYISIIISHKVLFSALKIFCVLSIHLSPLLFISCNHYSFYGPHTFSFSRILCN